MNLLTVNVYRAITGKPEFGGGKWKFSGVTDSQIRKTGFFLENSSITQSSRREQPAEAGITVTGLPVFLNRKEAEMWVEGNKYLDPPVIAETTIDLNTLFGENPQLKLMKNAVNDPKDIRALTEEELANHAQGIEQIKGECFIQGAKIPAIETELLRKNERFYRPSLDHEGQVIREMGYQEVRIKGSGEESTQLRRS